MEPSRLEAQVRSLRERNVVLEARLEGLQTVASALGASRGLDSVLQIIAQQVTRILGAERSTVYLVNPEGTRLEAKVIVGPEFKSLSLEVGQGIAGWVAQTGKTVNIKDAYRDRRFDSTFDEATGFRTRSILCQPMKNLQERTIGVVQVLNKESGYFTAEDARLLSTLTTQASISVENSQFFMQLKDSNFQLNEAQESLRANYARLETLYALQTEIAQTFDRELLAERVLGQISRAVSCHALALLLVKPGPAWVKFLEVGENKTVKTIKPASVWGILGAIVRTGDTYFPDGRKGESILFLHPEVDVGLVHVIGEPLKDPEGEPIGALALVRKRNREVFSAEDLQTLRIVARQVSVAMDRLRQHEELTRSNNLSLIGQALSGVLHDLKSPMGIISGYVQLMEMEEQTGKRAEYAGEVTKQFRHIAAMTQEVLAFSRGETLILKRPIYLQDFLAQMRVLLEKEFEGRHISVDIRNHYKGKLRADENKLNRLIFNLARNAREAMEGGGKFVIEVEEVEGRVQFRFTDTGVGIPPEVQDRMFQSFVTQGKKDGTGLGLAIVKKLVDQHDGTITFTTKRGVGTTFVITLPKGG